MRYGYSFRFGPSKFPRDPTLPASTVSAHSISRRLGRYSGNLIRVRRSSDNLEADIGFDGSGALDEAALLAHCGAGDGFIVTVYEQSGVASAVNKIQATASAQLQIVETSAVVKMGGIPTAKRYVSKGQFLVADNWATRPSSATVFHIGSVVSSDTSLALLGVNSAGNNRSWVADSGSASTSLANLAGSPSYHANGTLVATDGVNSRGDLWDATPKAALFLARHQSIDLSAAAWASISTRQANFSPQPFVNFCEEIIISGTSAADISAIEADQASFYGITLA